MKKYKYEDFRKNEDALNQLHQEIYNFIEKCCELSDVGDLPVQFMLRSKSMHYPFNDCFLIPSEDSEIERALELQASNLSCAMDRLKTLFQLKAHIARYGIKKY